MKELTQVQALEILQNEDSYHVPFRVLTPAGEDEIAEWVVKKANCPQDLEAWWSDAELAANEGLPTEPAIIEMPAHSTKSGVPETLIIPDNCFKWVIYE